jgi:acyl carrier protein
VPTSISQPLSRSEIESQIREFVWTSFLVDAGIDDVANNDDLFQLLDSLQVLRLVLHLKATYGVHVADDELAAENLGTIENVARFVDRKRAAA